MPDDLRPGDRVEWNAHGGKKRPKGKAIGRIVRKITSATKIKGHTAKATPQDPQYVVRTEGGSEAAHKPGALRKRR